MIYNNVFAIETAKKAERKEIIVQYKQNKENRINILHKRSPGNRQKLS